MNKPCAACTKVVYPLEQLKCLDQVWHKLCFKCQSCGMVLNMKNYKGFEKKPYCSAHYPQPSKFTVVSDTPEMQRVAASTRMISNIKYHEDFEKAKGMKISVTEDPQLRTQKQTMATISQAAYHANAEKRADMDARRNSIGERASATGLSDEEGQEEAQPASDAPERLARISVTSGSPVIVRQTRQLPGSVHDYTPGQLKSVDMIGKQRPLSSTFYSASATTNNTVVEDNSATDFQVNPQSRPQSTLQEQYDTPPPALTPADGTYALNSVQEDLGKITLTANGTGVPAMQGPRSTQSNATSSPRSSTQSNSPRSSVNSNTVPAPAFSNANPRPSPPRDLTASRVISQPPPPEPEPQQQQPQAGQTYRALYDYDGLEEDEVSFIEGDLILNGDPIDDGWMYGTVQRTGQFGMLPSNYVDPVD